ncbi:MAG: class I SAM-dependent methyltransferase [Candidatus Brennerbacteria bacterium]
MGVTNLFKRAHILVREKGWGVFIARVWKRIFRPFERPFFFLCSPLAIMWVKWFGREMEAEKLLRFSERLFLGIIRPIQIRLEILGFLRMVQKERPRTVLEIGTDRGGVLFLLTKLSAPNATLISLDLPAARGGYANWRRLLYRSFASPSQRMHFLKYDSHDPAALHAVSKILAGRTLDLLFIDGDHTYEGVKKDFLMYSPLVKNGGLVAFHDVAYHPFAGPDCEVEKFWNEIKGKYEHVELIEDKDQGWGGIGVLSLK